MPKIVDKGGGAVKSSTHKVYNPYAALSGNVNASTGDRVRAGYRAETKTFSPGARGGQRDKPYVAPKKPPTAKVAIKKAASVVTKAKAKAKAATTYKPTKSSGSSSSSGSSVTTTKGSSSSGSSSSSSSKSTSSTTNPYLKQAQDAVAAELNPKIKAVKDAQAAYDKSATEAQDKNQTRTKQTTHDIKYLYDNLDTKLQSQQAETQGAYTDTATKVDANYQALINKLKSATSQSVDKINSEAARLGLTAPAETQTSVDGNFTQQLADTNRQNAALMISAQGQNNKSTGDFLRQAEQGLGTQTSADFTKAQNNALNQLISDQQAQDTKFGTDLSNLEQQRSTMEQQYLQQLEQQAYNRAQEAQQQAFMNQLAVSKYNLSQDTFTANQAYRQAQLALEQQRIQLAAQKASGSGSGTTLNLTGAYNIINKTTDPSTKSAMQYAFDTAMQSGEYDFNNPADREKALNGMRAALIYKAPQYNTGSVMAALQQAYDTYLGKYNYA